MVKDKKFLENIAQFCLDRAKKLGATDCELGVSNSISESISCRNKKVDQSDRSDSLSVGLTVYIGKRKSNVSSSNVKEADLTALIERVVEMTKITPEDPNSSMPDKNRLAQEDIFLNLFDERNIATENKIHFPKQAIRGLHPS